MDFLKYLDLCRICLSDNGASIPIFSSITGEKTDLNEKLAVCFGEQIQDSYGYPRNICKSCNTKVNETVDFINKYKESQKVLEKALIYTIKQEINEYSDVEYIDDSFDYKGENNIKIEAIVFDNAQQFKELIQATNTKAEPGNNKNGKSNKNKTRNKAEPKNNKNGKSYKNKTSNKAEPKNNKNGKSYKNKTNTKADSKNGKSSINKGVSKKKKTDNRFKVSNSVIATAILEGEFTFASGQWRYRHKSKEKTEENIWKKDDTIKNNSMMKNNEVIQSKKDFKPTEPVSKLCEQCGEKFPSLEQFKRHKAKHQAKPIDPILFKCSICEKSFTTRENLKRHLTRVHGEKKFMCTQCGKTFTLANRLKKHNEEVHLNIRKKVTCKLCEKQFCNAKTLLVHERSAHTGERPAVCSVCGKSFVHNDYLNEHMRLHTGERPFKCPVCGQGYAQRCNMKSHIKHNHRLADIDEITLKNIHPRYYKFMKK